jgi:hypothetical protein
LEKATTDGVVRDALGVGDDDGVAGLEDRDDGVGGTEVDTDGLGHGGSLGAPLAGHIPTGVASSGQTRRVRARIDVTDPSTIPTMREGVE